MADAEPEWTVVHVEEQRYDIASMLEYDASHVKMWGPNVTDAATTGEDAWRQTFETVEAGERIRAALTPRLTGSPAPCRIQISWTDNSGEHRFEWYTVPIPGRTRLDLESPFPRNLGC
jgi:hypothetical protein